MVAMTTYAYIFVPN